MSVSSKDNSIMEGKIRCSKTDLQLRVTFNCGQCYRWNPCPDGSWIGVFNHLIWIIKHENEYLYYKVKGDYNKSLKENSQSKIILQNYLEFLKTVGQTCKNSTEDELLLNSVLWDYFRMYENLDEHYKRWSACDPNFRAKAEKFYGLRMLKQDSVEILFTFICSSNTTISRITTMVEKLCSLYGEKIGEVNGTLYYDFPEVSKLAEPSVLKDLERAKFGYRASYVTESAKKIMGMGGKDWIYKLNSLSHKEAKLEMMKLPGIGEKVADCVCLMGLNHLNAIPVDTHVFQISKLYIPQLKERKSPNKAIYNRIGEHFRNLFGHHAGWAHVVLFCADLKMHQGTKKASRIKKPTKKQTSKAVSKYFSTATD